MTDTRSSDYAEMMHGDGYVAVLKRVPCPNSHDCLAHRERVLTLTVPAARELAGELLRGARYVEDRGA
jgi:hypothetical protein